MWKNGKEGNTEGNTEGRRIMEGTDGSGRWEMIEAEEKKEPRKGGMRQAREGERQERRRENRVGRNKIIAAWLRRCGIK